MKKIISLGMVLVLILGIGVLSFADEVETTFQKGFGRSNSMNEDFERGNGIKTSMNEGEFETYRVENKINLSLKFQESTATIEILSDLTGDSVETIQTSGLTLHEYAENKGVLATFQESLLTEKESKLNELVVNGTITQEKADFMIERMSQMEGTQPQQRLGQKNEKQQRQINKGRGRKNNQNCSFQ